MINRGPSVVIPPMVSHFLPRLGWVTEQDAGASPTSAAYISAQTAFYYPLVLPTPCVIRRVWWANGATTTGGATIEVGIYADSGGKLPGAKVISGSATQGTALEVQFVDVTDTAIAAGVYWIAILSSSVTNTTLMRSLRDWPHSGSSAREQGSLGALPTSATSLDPVDWGDRADIYLCGFATTASP